MYTTPWQLFRNVLLLMNSNEDAYFMQLKFNFPQQQSK